MEDTHSEQHPWCHWSPSEGWCLVRPPPKIQASRHYYQTFAMKKQFGYRQHAVYLWLHTKYPHIFVGSRLSFEVYAHLKLSNTIDSCQIKQKVSQTECHIQNKKV